MSSFYLHVVRTFKPGLFPASDLKTELESRDYPGFVTMAPNTPNPNGGFTSIGTRIFDSSDTLEKYDDELMNDIDQNRAKLSLELASQCVSQKGYIFQVIEEFENNTEITPKYLVRVFMRAKHGRQSEVIDLLKNGRENMDGNKPAISVLRNGSSGIVRLTHAHDSMNSVKESFSRADSMMKSDLGIKLIDATQNAYRQMSRILFTHKIS